MSDDLVRRLRQGVEVRFVDTEGDYTQQPSKLELEAADRIEELEVALWPFAKQANDYDDMEDPDSRKIDDLGIADITIGHCRTARALLQKDEDR